MTGEDKRIFDSRGSTQQFLLSKTDTRRLLQLEEKSLADADDELKSAFPGVLAGKDFIEDALRRLDSAEQFSSMVFRLDDANRNNENPGDEAVKSGHICVAEILNEVCEAEKGFWGALEPGLFGSFFPDKNGSESLKIACEIQKRLKKQSGETVSIGVAAYPSDAYEKPDIVDNACKAIEHASFFGPDSAVVFDAVSLNISADKLYEKGKIDEAVEELKKALLLDPANVNVHNSLGVCYSIQGKHELATAEFNAAIAVDPREHMGYYNLGLVNVLAGRRDQALKFFLKANEIKSEVFEVAIQIGKLYLDLSDPQNARPFLEQAIELNPKSGAAHRFVGDCHVAGNRPDEAIPAYKNAIKRNPRDAASMSALGHLYEERGENQEIALMFCRESVKLSPENGLFRYRLGRLHYNHNRYDEALEEFKKAEQFGYDAGEDIQETANRLAKKSA
jgi:tetratricopeptide (TPR) repeat protein